MKDGDAVITPAFGIKNAKVIIHAVGPDFGVTPEAFEELVSAYYNSLVVMMENGYHSISFPLISSGIFGGNLRDPVKVSAIRCSKAARKFAAKYPNYDFEIRLCAFTDSEYNSAKEFFGEREDISYE